MAVDTSVLLAIFKGEPKGERWLESLQSAAETKTLLVSSVVVSEIRSFFSSDSECRKAMQSLNLEHSTLTEEASLLAGKMFRMYRQQGGPRNDTPRLSRSGPCCHSS